MTKKPASILKLEKQLGLDIIYIPFAEQMRNNTIAIQTYSTDKNGNVILLRLYDCTIKPEWLEPFRHLQQLTLHNCGLTDISFIESFTKLYLLDISKNHVEDISPLFHLDGLLSIDIRSNEIFDLSPLYRQISQPGFQNLLSNGNPLIYPSPEAAEKGVGAILGWFDLQLEKARELINESKESLFPILTLSNLGITDLSLLPELFTCTHIHQLDLDNQLDVDIETALPNNIFYIPPDISQLTKLHRLYINGLWLKDGQFRASRVRSFTPFEKLKNLELLDISYHKIKGSINLTSLINLQNLSASRNLISNVGSHYILRKLEYINLSNNQLKNADFLKKIPNAGRVDLRNNQISNLYEVREIVLKKGIDVENEELSKGVILIGNNPLDVPNMEVVSQGMEAVEQFFKQYEAERSVHIPPYKNIDIKLILAGNSNAGKSSLIERLVSEKWNEQLPTTHWMEIKRWQPTHNNRKFNIRIFDFGGQEYYHDTHYLFFSNNTAYVLLWDMITNNYDECEIQQVQKDLSKIDIAIQGFPIPYWLESIAFHTQRKIAKEEANIMKLIEASSPKRTTGRDIKRLNKAIDQYANVADLNTSFILKTIINELISPNILVVQNKVDSAAKKSFLNQEQLKKEFDSIYDFASISAKTGRGIDHFKDLLFEMIDSMSIAERECLGTWGAIKQEIENGVNEKDREMPLADFRKFCNHIISLMPEVKNAGLKSTDALWFSLADTQSYARYLNDIGLILYFPDNDYLKDKVFVKQDYVLKKIYDILEGLHGLNGKFDEAHVINALGKQKFDKECETIIELMKHFKIVFPHPSQPGTYIAPLYLPARPSKSISIFLDDGHRPSYRFLFQGFIHKHIILEFFHLYGQHALKDEHGQQYYYWKNGIVIRDEPSQGIVMVRFINATATSKAYIDVFSLSKSADKSFLKKITDELERLSADMNVKKAVTADGENFVPIDVLHAAETTNQWVFQHNGIYFDLKLFRAHLKNELKMKKIFISYSKTDAHYLQQLENHLSALKRNGSISTWNCRQLVPGDKWDGKIKSELEEADIIIFLVSADFMATDYIWDIEIKRAIERENENPDVKVVPIIIRSCAWEDTPLSVYNTAPKKAMVLDLAKNIDEAFTDAVRDLKKIL